MAIALAIAGKIGSGKTTVTKSLAKTLGWPRASFGDYVRAVASTRGVPQTRAHLQDLGTLLLRDDPREFCRAVLSNAGWETGQSLVIDGLRHAETIEIIRELVSPAVLRIVLISVSDETRLRRLAERGEGEAATIGTVEAHSSEQQVSSVLASFADLTLIGDEPSDAIVCKLIGWIRNQQCNH